MAWGSMAWFMRCRLFEFELSTYQSRYRPSRLQQCIRRSPHPDISRCCCWVGSCAYAGTHDGEQVHFDMKPSSGRALHVDQVHMLRSEQSDPTLRPLVLLGASPSQQRKREFDRLGMLRLFRRRQKRWNSTSRQDSEEGMQVSGKACSRNFEGYNRQLQTPGCTRFK